MENKKLKYCENLPNNSHNDIQDSISICDMSKKDLSPLSNTNYVSKVINENTFMDHLRKSEIDDTHEKNKRRIEAEIRLENAFRECITEMNSDLPINKEDTFNTILKQLNEKYSTTETNHKRKTLLSDEFDTDKISNSRSCDVQKDHSYCEHNNKKIIYNDKIDQYNAISEQSPKSCQEIINGNGIHNDLCFDNCEIKDFTKTYKRFLQKSICLNLPSTIDKCIECRVHQMKNNLTKREYDAITCRFYAFRELKYTKSGILTVAGFPDPFKNIGPIDMDMWLPGNHSAASSDFNIKASTKILEDAGSQFCKLVRDEIEALNLNLPSDGKTRKILWKKCVKGVREMCDVCKTTIFNHHWSCGKCGFVVCVDCFRAKLKGTLLTEKENIKQRNFNKKIWLHCSNQKEHQVENLSITQILAGNALEYISDLMHDICYSRNIPLNCNCEKSKKIMPPVYTDSVLAEFLTKVYGKSSSDDSDDTNDTDDIDDADDNEEQTLGMQDLIKKQHFNYYNSIEGNDGVKSDYEVSTSISRKNIEDEFCKAKDIRKKKWFTPKLSLLSDDKTHVPHMWLCEGQLLRLLDPKSDNNYTIFQVIKDTYLFY